MSKSRKLDEIVADLRKGIGPTVIQIWLSTDKTVGELEHRIDEIRRTLADDIEAATCPPPRRNCDVGTPEEQAKRHADYCSLSRSCFHSGCIRKCFAEWAQMPYGNKPTTNHEPRTTNHEKQEESK